MQKSCTSGPYTGNSRGGVERERVICEESPALGIRGHSTIYFSAPAEYLLIAGAFPQTSYRCDFAPSFERRLRPSKKWILRRTLAVVPDRFAPRPGT